MLHMKRSASTNDLDLKGWDRYFDGRGKRTTILKKETKHSRSKMKELHSRTRKIYSRLTKIVGPMTAHPYSRRLSMSKIA